MILWGEKEGSSKNANEAINIDAKGGVASNCRKERGADFLPLFLPPQTSKSSAIYTQTPCNTNLQSQSLHRNNNLLTDSMINYKTRFTSWVDKVGSECDKGGRT